MTLSTNFIIKDPTPPEEAFRFAQSLLSLDPSKQAWHHEGPDEHIGSYRRWPQAYGTWANEIGQGLPAILEVEYGIDGPLREDGEDELNVNDEDRAWHAEYRDHMTGCVRVWFDTGYFYRADNGAGCGDLHAFLVSSLGMWCEARGLKFEFNNESTDEWFDDWLACVSLGDPQLGCPPELWETKGWTVS